MVFYRDQCTGKKSSAFSLRRTLLEMANAQNSNRMILLSVYAHNEIPFFIGAVIESVALLSFWLLLLLVAEMGKLYACNRSSTVWRINSSVFLTMPWNDCQTRVHHFDFLFFFVCLFWSCCRHATNRSLQIGERLFQLIRYVSSNFILDFAFQANGNECNLGNFSLDFRRGCITISHLCKDTAAVDDNKNSCEFLQLNIKIDLPFKMYSSSAGSLFSFY